MPRVLSGAVIRMLIFQKPKMKFLTPIALILSTTCLSGQSNVLDSYTPEALKSEIAAQPKVILLDFESKESQRLKAVTKNITSIQVELDESTARQGEGVLRVGTVDDSQGHHSGSPVFELHLNEPVDFSKYRALSFWFYVPPEKTDFFFGRHDIRVQLNKSNTLMRTWPAVVAGWNWYVFEFSGLEDLPMVERLRIRLGPFLEGYDESDLLFDHFELTPMNAAELESKSWSSRYQALNELVETSGMDSLETVLEACSDESLAVRSLAVRLATALAPKNPEGALPALRKVLQHQSWRSRLAALQIIANIQDLPGLDAESIYEEALLDDVFYLRDFAYQQLRSIGRSPTEIATVLKAIAREDVSREVPVIRMLSEVGPEMDSALSYLRDVVRDTTRAHTVRCWALRATWEIDESILSPEDWALALDLNPGEIHYHLLNRAMDRLEQASEKAVPVLVAKLSSRNPEARARACSILGQIGPKAAGASQPLKALLSDDAYVAWEADQALGKILPGHVSSIKESSDPDSCPDDVEVLVTETTTTIRNGLVEMVFKNGDESPGPYIVRKPGGINLFEADWLETILAFKHSKAPNMVERQWLQRLFGSPFSRDVTTRIRSATPDQVDYEILFKGGDSVPIEFEYHFVLKRGESGFYTYMITRNVSGKELVDHQHAGQIGVGRFSFLVALTQGAFDYSFLHDRLKGPAAFTKILQEPLIEKYPDIYQSAYRLPSGDVGAKHEWDNYELFSEVVGYTSQENGGVWLITPSEDFMDDTMPRFTKRPCYGLLFIPHLQGKYHIQTGQFAPSDWEKYYGPMFFYLNAGDSPEEMWVDAKREAAAHVKQWPYEWVEEEAYHDRGSVTGTLSIADGTSPEGAYVVLANPDEGGDPDQYGIWMRNIGAYNYWAQADADGSFTIPDVHSGSYQLFAFQPGVYGEAGPVEVEIESGESTPVGQLQIEPVSNGQLLWRIGVPDGTAMEFKNGRNYHQWDNYIRYRKDFPEDVDFVVGESDWSEDWNYIHPAIVQGEKKPTSWTISFNMDAVPDAETLLSVMCSGRKAKAQVLLNGAKIGDLKVDIGAHHARTAPVGETVCRKFQIRPDQLCEGTNTLEITFSNAQSGAETKYFQSWTSWLCYDFIQLELLR